MVDLIPPKIMVHLHSLRFPVRLPLGTCALLLCALLLASLPAVASHDPVLPVITATLPHPDPLTITSEPRRAQDGLQATDGAGYLKSLNGFSVIRKGGTDGDPLLRGMGGSRLGIIVDGQEIAGGCGGRMDPPTAYLHPESFDRITVRKGPQSVRYGAGQSAGVVLFEHDDSRPASATWQGNASMAFGSFRRNDQAADIQAATPDFYIKADANRTESDHYRDGDGQLVHSRFMRWHGHAIVGITPDEHTRLELSAATGDGRAAYADRAMDATKLQRNNIAVRAERQHLAPWLPQAELLAYINQTDHVMDNYAMRSHVTDRKNYRAVNPERTVTGIRTNATINWSSTSSSVIGMEYKQDTHRSRSGESADSAAGAIHAYQSQPFRDNMQFRQTGVFAETTHQLATDWRLIHGIRLDWYRAQDRRQQEATAGQTDARTLPAAFVRFESDYAQQHGTHYIGIGHVQRSPDYWERLRKRPDGQGNGFSDIAAEKTTQIDVGSTYRRGDTQAAVSAFYGQVSDYILINWDQGVARNIAARTFGTEAEITHDITPHWQAAAAVAWVHAHNRTDHRPLAQQPPTEWRLATRYHHDDLAFGVHWRLASAQHRIDKGSGGIVAGSKDLGPTGGFGVVSLDASWQMQPGVTVRAGVDNLFNKTYAEHLSKSGQSEGMSSQPLYMPGTRINEPGRTLWIRAQMML